MATNRDSTGSPSMAVSPKGRLSATWYAGGTPGKSHRRLTPYFDLSNQGGEISTCSNSLS